METIHSINLIASNPDVRAGRPVIAGTSVRVSDVVIAHQVHQLTPEEIIERYYPQLSLAQIHAALAYYYQHQTEIDDEIAQDDQTAAALKENRVGSRHKPLSG